MCTYIYKSTGFFNLLADIIHHFIISTRNIDFLDASRRQLVHQFTQNDAIAESILITNTGWEAFTNDSLDPLLSLSFLFWDALSGNL